jgi:hypothetical protein
VKEYDFKGVIQAISEASPSHLALVSFLVLPVVMNYWLETLMKVLPELSTCWKVIALSFLVGVYLFCLWWLVRENEHQKRMERKRDQIIGRLVSNDWTKITFDSARKALTDETTDEEIISLIEAFPKSLRYVQVRKRDEQKNLVKDAEGKQVYAHGIGVVAAPQETNGEDA